MINSQAQARQKKAAHLRKLWVMTPEQLNQFNNHRQLAYKGICQQNQLERFPDEKLLKYYVWNIVCFLRSRKYPADKPFKFQKMIFTAISLIKRYYLINPFGVDGQEPMQICICAMYLSMKLNEYSSNYIEKMVLAWRGKEVLQTKRVHCHYGDEGYSDKQFKLLSGIGFQTARSKIINTLQSLHGKLVQSSNSTLFGGVAIGAGNATKISSETSIQHNNSFDSKIPSELLYQIKKCLQKLYINTDLLFLVEGSKLSLGIFLHCLEKLKYKISDFQYIYGEHFSKLLAQNKEQIREIVQKCQKLQTYDQQTVKQSKTEYFYKMTRNHYRKPDFKKSPRFHARHDSSLE